MFENQAEEYADGIYHYKINVSDYGEDGKINYRYSDIKEAYQKGAEFAYNKAEMHDYDKIHDETEKAMFDEYTPKLKHCTYGSDEYKSFLAGLKPALDIHYANNRHHPEHFENGIHGMNLLDVLEMICDWKASSERHSDGDIYESIEINQKRFGYSDDLKNILKNTAIFLSIKRSKYV